MRYVVFLIAIIILLICTGDIFMQSPFNNALYIEQQTKHIKERISLFGDKLYLEFGGKLFDDYHASRVLPGFEPDNKIKLLLEFKDI